MLLLAFAFFITSRALATPVSDASALYKQTGNPLALGVNPGACSGCHFAGTPASQAQSITSTTHILGANDVAFVKQAFTTGKMCAPNGYCSAAGLTTEQALKLAIYIGQFTAPQFTNATNVQLSVRRGFTATTDIYPLLQTGKGLANDIHGVTATNGATATQVTTGSGASFKLAYNLSFTSALAFGDDSFVARVANAANTGGVAKTVNVRVYGISSAAATTEKATGTVFGVGSPLYTVTSNDSAATFAASVVKSGGPALTLADIGLQINASTGAITGTLNAAAGTYVVTAVATIRSALQGNGDVSQQVLSLSVPEITSLATAAFTQDLAVTPPGYQITVSAGATVAANGYSAEADPSPGASVTGSLPPGMTFSTSSGRIAGTPTSSGTYSVIVGATTVNGVKVTKKLTITVASAGRPVITANPALAASPTVTLVGTVGSPITGIQINASRPPISTGSYIATGLAATGLLLDPNTGAISSTPSASGEFEVTLGASNASGQGTLLVKMRINPNVVPVVTSTPALAASPAVTGTVGTAITPIQVNAANGPITAGSYNATGLPGGLAVDPNSGALGGTPTESGEFDVVLRASNMVGQGSSAQVRIRINPNLLPVVTSTPALVASPAVTGTVGTGITPVQIQASNGPITVGSYSATGLPGGLAVDPASGVLGGTPSESGEFDVVLRARNAVGQGSSAQVRIRINPNLLPVVTSTPALAASPAVTGTVGTGITPVQVNASNGPITAGSYSATGLPAGLAVDPNSGVLGGTPSESGEFDVVLRARNVVGQGSSAQVRIRINPNLVPVVTSTPALAASPAVTGTVGTALTPLQVNASNGPITAGSYSATGLPAGLAVDPNSGVLGGTPSESGEFDVVLRARNGVGQGSSVQVKIRINPNQVPVLSGATTVMVNANQAFAGYQITASNPVILGYAVVAPSVLPAGLSLNPATGVIGGTPTQSGALVTSLRATNAAGPSADFALSFTIVPTTLPQVTVPLQAAPAVTGTVGTAISAIQISATNPAITGYGATGLPGGLSVNGAGQIVGTPSQSGDFTVTATAANSSGTGSSVPVTIRINPSQVPVVTSTPALGASPAVTGTVGAAIAAVQINATNGLITAGSYSATGLPAGLAVDPNSGVLSGTPTQSGDFGVVLRASNLVGQGSSALVTIRINPNLAPVVTSMPALAASPAVTGTVGAAITAVQINASNGPITAGGYSATGLPAGLVVDANSGVLSGTPTQSGEFSVVLRASNLVGQGSTAAVTIRINPSAVPVLSGATTVTTNANQAFAGYQIIASNPVILGYAVVSPSVLPGGLTLNTVTGAISGTPTQSGAVVTNLRATNAAGPSLNFPLSFTIVPTAMPQVTVPLQAAPTVTGTVGTPISAIQISATNPVITGYGATGLPGGLSVNGAGQIVGTPTQSGDFTVTATAANSSGTGSSTPVTIRINPSAVPVLSGAATVTANANQAFAGYQITASNPVILGYAVVAPSVLPAGLTLNEATGAISGTPAQSGTVVTNLRATNAAGASANFALTFTIVPTTIPQVTVPLLASPAVTGTVGTAISAVQINATNPLITAYGATGLPGGLSVNGSGQIVGTPTQSGDFAVTVSATNSSGTGSAAPVTIRINPNVVPAITSAAVIAAPANRPLAGYQIVATNSPVLSYAVVAPSTLPPGLSLDSATGFITGTPTASGSFSTVLSASNAAGAGTPFTLTLQISPSTSPAITSPTFASVSVGAPIRPIPVVATNGPIVSYAATGLPPGLVIDAATGVISGTPLAPGPYQAVITATNAIGPGSLVVPFTIGIPVPGACAMSVPLNTATTVDLATCLFAGFVPTGVNIVATASHGSAVASGTQVTYTPVHNYFGADSFSFVGIGAAGTSPQGTVTVTITGRPDPALDPIVTAVIGAQAEASQRFTRAQLSNYQRRMELLHRGAGQDGEAGVGLQQPRPALADDGFAAAAASVRVPAPAAAALPLGATSPGSSGNLGNSSGLGGVGAGPTGANWPGGVPRAPVAATESQFIDAVTSGLGLKSLPFADNLMSLMRSRSLNLAGVASGLGLNNNIPMAQGGTSYWVEGVASFGTRDASGSTSGAEFSSDGITVGVDKRFSDKLAVGMGLGYARDLTKIGTDGSRNRSKAYSLAVYGSYQAATNTYIDALLGIGSLDFDSTRYVAPVNDFAYGQRGGTQVFGSLTAGYEFRDGNTLVSPYGRLDFSTNRLKSATETGAGSYALMYYGQTSTSLQAALGVRGESVHPVSFGYVAPSVRAELRHEFQGSGQAFISYADQIGGTRYAVAPVGNGRNSLVLGLGSDFLFRDGLTLSVEYQLSQSFAHDSSYALRLRLSKDFDVTGMPKLPNASTASSGGPLDLQVEAGYVRDDNITRAKSGPDKLSDDNYSVNVSKATSIGLSGTSRLLLTGTVTGEKFHHFNGLSNLAVTGEAEYQYRGSAEFDEPVFGVFGRLSGLGFETALRDGYRASVGVSAQQALTDRINVFGALAYNRRHAKSAVFSTKDVSARFNVDYALSDSGTLYVGTEFRRGDIVSTGRPSLENASVADVLVQDDAYPGGQFFSYRFDGRTVLATIGYNLSMGNRDSIDFSWRRIQSTPGLRPSFVTSPRSYKANQFSATYLMRF